MNLHSGGSRAFLQDVKSLSPQCRSHETAELSIMRPVFLVVS